MAPAALLEAGRTEVCGYGVQVLDGRVDELAKARRKQLQVARWRIRDFWSRAAPSWCVSRLAK